MVAMKFILQQCMCTINVYEVWDKILNTNFVT